MVTLDELSAAVSALTDQVAALAIEVQRGKDMIQTISEDSDQNRRELLVATTTAITLNNQLPDGVISLLDGRMPAWHSTGVWAE